MKKTALVVDDNRETADSLGMMITFMGLEVSIAYGSGPAMVHLKETKPDIVFMDINMPGLSGFEVMSYLRRYPHLMDVPVVFVTSDDQPETADRARKTGALLVLIKPVSIDAVESALRKAGVIEL